MLNQTHRMSWATAAYLDYCEYLTSTRIKKNLVCCRSYESMKFGYEQMAQINLDMCSWGGSDFDTSIKIIEDDLNGDDSGSDY